jgi:hypothetical protein
MDSCTLANFSMASARENLYDADCFYIYNLTKEIFTIYGHIKAMAFTSTTLQRKSLLWPREHQSESTEIERKVHLDTDLRARARA